MRLLFIALVALVVSSCALRPRYNDFPRPTTSETVFQLVDDQGQPLKGTKVDLGEGKARVQAVTRDDGTFTVPFNERLVSDNPIFAVTVPVGVGGYSLRVFEPPKPQPVPAPAPAPVAPEAAPTTP